MAEEKRKKEFKPGSKKGGAIFPKYSLKQLIPNLKDLLSKTHTKTINMEQLNSGVFKIGAKSKHGEVRYSAMKQFGLAEGLHEAIKSTDLASKIVHSIGDEKILFIRQAFLNVRTFRNTFETYQDSAIPKDKIKGYVSSTLNVHPDSTNVFLECFLDSALEAKLCADNGDEIVFTDGKGIQLIDETEINTDSENEVIDSANSVEINESPVETQSTTTETSKDFAASAPKRIKAGAPSIELKIDPTLDPDKLEKQLEVLRKFGLV